MGSGENGSCQRERHCNMPKIKSEVSVSMAVLLIALAASASCLGCGSDQATGDRVVTTFRSFKAKSVGGCLKRAGATQATSPKDLKFLAEAEGNDEVQKPGFVYDRSENLVVRLWSQIGFEGSRPRWTVWFAQPFNKSYSPRGILDEESRKSYVMYSVHPSMVQRKKQERCLHF